jgi:membrane-associated phospholipid phosphatase
MSKESCKGVKPEQPRPDTKELTGKCADRTNCDIGPQEPDERADTARDVRVAAADFERKVKIPKHPCNCDEVRYRNQNFFASYTKGLKKINKFGEVDPDAYCALLAALESGKPADFEKIPLGCTEGQAHPADPVKQVRHELESRFAPGPSGATMPPVQRRLTNPQSALAFDLEGTDSHQLAIPPAPSFDSDEEAAEMIELYWQALARDVHFSDYGKEPITQAAIKELNGLGSAFTGPKEGGKVTAQTLFRGFAPGDTVGPYISQFMLLPIPFGARMIDNKVLTVKSGIDYVTNEADWLNVQKGCTPTQTDQIDRRVFIRNGRDIGQYVHIDVLYQAYFEAMLILLTKSAPSSGGAGIGAPFDDNNPYTAANSKTQDGFGTFGGPHIAALVAEVATRALKAVWYQKWSVHRRLRPEEFGGRIHFDKTGQRPYPFSDLVRNSQAAQEVFKKYKTYFLPQAFPEGSPTHPAYGAGHATVAGACVTLLKAWFKEDTKLSDLGVTPVVADAAGNNTVPYTGADKNNLTVAGELNKLAANVALARNFAGVHWRTDYTASARLGEAVTISILEDSGFTYNEDFKGFTLTKFDGTTVTVGKKRKP